jgi:hypothetical protein
MTALLSHRRGESVRSSSRKPEAQVGDVTFGFMDPEQDASESIALFAQLRMWATESFAREGTCDLRGFLGYPVEELDATLRTGFGPGASSLRDRLYDHVAQTGRPIRFPDIQSFFLFAFTLGINQKSPALLAPEDRQNLVRASIPDVVARRFPIHGPQWLSTAANREMPHVENAFCDFQDEVLIPFAKREGAGRRVADAIAGAFLWAMLAGVCWIEEAVHEIAGRMTQLGLEPAMGMYQVKRCMALLTPEEVERVVNADEPA